MKKQNENKARTDTLAEPAQYSVMMPTATGEVKIGHAFELTGGDIVLDLAALPMSGQARLRKVGP